MKSCRTLVKFRVQGRPNNHSFSTSPPAIYLQSRRHIQNTVPFIRGMLVNLRSHYHLRHAIPRVHLLSFIIETNQPRIRPGAKGKHGKSITKSVLSHLKLEVIHGPSTDESLIVITHRDSVVALNDSLAQLDDKGHDSCTATSKYMGMGARMLTSL